MATPDSPTGPALMPRRAMLRPGLRVTRRDDQHLQVGIGPDRLLLASSPATLALLRRLAAGHAETVDEPGARAVCERLARAGMLVDAAAFARSPVPGPATSAAYAADPGGAEATLHRRVGQPVTLDVPEAWRALLDPLLAAVGLAVAPDPAAGVVQLLGREGEPSRSATDLLMREGVAHLLVTCVDGVLTVGPFVRPGRTACLRCVDARLAESDPRRALVVEQYSSPDTARPVPEPVDPALLVLALGWAVRDLVTWVDGGTPSLWSASVALTGDLDLSPRHWARHPHCGCCWGDALAG